MPPRRSRSMRKRPRARSARSFRPRRVKRKANRGRSSFNFRALKAISRAMAGPRTYRLESRNDSLASPQNQARWCVLTTMACRQDIEAAISSVHGTGAINTGIGEWNGAYESSLEQSKIDITGFKQTVHFRNIDVHEQFLELYECQFTKTMSKDGTPAVYAMKALSEAHEQYMGSDTNTATSKFGSNIGDLNSTVYDTYSAGISLVRPINRAGNYIKVVKSMKYKLNPGDDVYWTMRVQNRVWNPQKIYNQIGAAGTETADVVGNYSKFLLVKLCGTIGRSSAAGGESVIGLMQTEISYDIMITAKLSPLLYVKPEQYMKTNVDDLTAITMEGPTEEDLKIDNADEG